MKIEIPEGNYNILQKNIKDKSTNEIHSIF